MILAHDLNLLDHGAVCEALDALVTGEAALGGLGQAGDADHEQGDGDGSHAGLLGAGE